MNIRALMAVIAILTPLFLSSQNFDLNTYKYRYQMWQRMGATFNFSGGHMQQSSKNEITYGSNNPIQLSSVDQNAHSVAFTAPFFFDRFINIDRLQRRQSFRYEGTFNKSKSSEVLNLYSLHKLSYNFENNFYRGKNFKILNISTNNSYSIDKSKYPEGAGYSLSKYNKAVSNMSYNVSIGAGRGRLDVVTDAVSAIFILKDLKRKAGIGDYTNAQIEAVAKGITTINNTRFMDYRFGLISQLTLLDSVLKANGIIPTSEIAYFTTINDNWLYANRFSRMSGQKWSVSLNSQGSRNTSEELRQLNASPVTNQSNFYQNNMATGMVINYINSRQLGLFFQRNFSFALQGNLNNNTYKATDQAKNKSDVASCSFVASFGYLYQPNTRTYFQLDLSAYSTASQDLYGFRAANPSELVSRRHTMSFNSRLDFFRFISQRLYYGSSISFNYVGSSFRDENHKDDTVNKGRSEFLPFQFSAGLTYLIF